MSCPVRMYTTLFLPLSKTTLFRPNVHYGTGAKDCSKSKGFVDDRYSVKSWAHSAIWLTAPLRAGHRVVNCPTRWSLFFIFVFLCWSSSWRLVPHIEGGRLLWPPLKAGMTVLTQFFCKMYSRGRKNFFGEILGVLPLQKQLFFSTLRFAKIAEYAEMTICFTEATRLLESTRSLVPSNF